MAEISKVEILSGGEMLVALEGGGDPSYQYIYREAREVHWDNGLGGFKTPPPRTWGYAHWLKHVIHVAGEFGVPLTLTENTKWVNVPAEVQKEILG